jgi:hypothetical protein
MMSETHGQTRGTGQSTPSGGAQFGTGERDETKTKTVKTFRKKTEDEALSGEPSPSKRLMKPRDDPKTS